ncbi:MULTISPECIES: thioesterase family protein [unclassified Undibacterium]|uniref:acyl-CoA thioesterase n=2 Tax=Pseudomonadota TaxID=1224 RepID=UPI002AC95DB8|nr:MULTISPECIES: thioesterase family protein [unclassified Undibacterium]MEB0139158.1 thioesterase family protein [Undibacterium sp. CCC2.1]MEB0172862.1 thioesterase family protein [Undibacterium sp. CCC1.1]MEB0176666.1 thioesterase family protein [Undibacterium sp. CCC3.4]MEB0216006.1 thioesterase family protein [Undibacterium sp. 5I2]WPX43153.1 thioesterase family protein [Undibacterium sp. CCC3.4]
MARQDFTFFHALRVRWSEVDMQAVVFNGNYLNYVDVAFTEYWRATGLPNAQQQAREGQELYARKAGLEYLAPARFDDVLTIGMRCGRIGNSSMQFLIEIYRDTDLLVSGELVYVYADTAARRAVTVNPAWRAIIMNFETLAPA